MKHWGFIAASFALPAFGPAAAGAAMSPADVTAIVTDLFRSCDAAFAKPEILLSQKDGSAEVLVTDDGNIVWSIAKPPSSPFMDAGSLVLETRKLPDRLQIKCVAVVADWSDPSGPAPEMLRTARDAALAAAPAVVGENAIGIGGPSGPPEGVASLAFGKRGERGDLMTQMLVSSDQAFPSSVTITALPDQVSIEISRSRAAP